MTDHRQVTYVFEEQYIELDLDTILQTLQTLKTTLQASGWVQHQALLEEITYIARLAYRREILRNLDKLIPKQPPTINRDPSVLRLPEDWAWRRDL